MTPETDHQRAVREARLAIEIVTMWMHPAWGHLNPAERMAAFHHVDQVRATEDADTVFSGQLTLTMLLLSKLAEARGATEENLMDEVGNIRPGDLPRAAGVVAPDERWPPPAAFHVSPHDHATQGQWAV